METCNELTVPWETINNLFLDTRAQIGYFSQCKHMDICVPVKLLADWCILIIINNYISARIITAIWNIHSNPCQKFFPFTHTQKFSFALKFQAEHLRKQTKWQQANKPSPAWAAQPQHITGGANLLECLGTNHKGQPTWASEQTIHGNV